MLAWLVLVPAAVGCTVTVTVTLSPGFIVPIAQVTLPAEGAPQLPCVAVAETNVLLAGSVSVSETPVADDGPAVAMDTLYERLLPWATGLGVAVCETPRSAEPLTVTPAEAALLVKFGSLSAAATEAVLLSVPRVAGATLTTTVTVAPLPLARVPRLQGRAVQLPWLEATETGLTPAGSVSLTVTAEAELAPLLVIVRVYVRLLPANTVPELAEVLMATSAAAAMMVPSLAVLFPAFVSPPPDTLAEFVKLAGALAATSTVRASDG
jgi:hypothetical protein